jgi:ubiquinone/menaquinone biosynthesis C-methylase UbiE
LQLQAGIVGGITRRLISESGIKPGMRVLDIGCGAGDVSMLLAEAIGDGGSVLAFDREPRAIAGGARPRLHTFSGAIYFQESALLEVSARAHRGH